MRDLLNIFDSVLNEVTISKAKYGPGSQFSVATGSKNGQALLQLINRKSTRLNSSHTDISRMPSSA